MTAVSPSVGMYVPLVDLTQLPSAQNVRATLTSILALAPAQSFASITGKPTTLAGYGITDGVSSTGTTAYGLGFLSLSDATAARTYIGAGTGTVTSVNLTAPAAGITVAGGPITTSGSITLALANDLAALEALTGTDTIYYRSGVSTWTAVTVGANLSFAGGTLSASAPGTGTVTSFSSGDLSPLFTTSVATATTTPALSFSLSTQAANLVFAGPTTGAPAAPTFRSLVTADIPALDYLLFNFPVAPAWQEGLVFYDETEHTLAYYNDESTVTHNIGQESWIRVRNVTGVTIANGSAVYISGAVGNRPTVALADADAAASAFTIGVATHDIPNNTDGYITSFGVVHELNTSSFSDGDELWLSSTPGVLVNVMPTDPAFIVFVGIVTRSHITQGSIFVNPDAVIPKSSETIRGLIEIATQAETNTGTDDIRAITPLKFQTRLAAYSQPLDAALTALATGSDFVVFTGPLTSNKTFTLPNTSATILTDNAAVTVAQGGTGAATLTGLLQGNGTSAFTAITNSSTVGQVLRVTGASTYAWGALDLADTDAVTGILPSGNGGTGNAFFAVIGPATSTKTYTFPNASSSVYTTASSSAYTALPFTLAGSRLLGNSGLVGPVEEISIGTGLTLSASTLSLDATAAVTSITGTAAEITASAAVGAVTLSLPTALTFTGKTVTGGTFNSGAFNGTVGATTPSTGAFLSADGSGTHTVNITQQTTTGFSAINILRLGTSQQAIRFAQATDGNEVGSITLSTTATAYNTSSDRRLKVNIRDYKGSAEIIESIRVRQYDWKTGEKNSVGFVAQELHEVYPAAVTKGDDGEKITQQWAVDYSKLVPVLVAEIQALRARVAVLEAAK